MSYIYLASPYSHPDRRVRRDRYFAALDAVAWMLAKRIWVYSPIVHCHFAATEYELPTDATHWRPYNQAMLREARRLWILQTPGFAESAGIRNEIHDAESMGITMGWIYPEGNTYKHSPLPELQYDTPPL